MYNDNELFKVLVKGFKENRFKETIDSLLEESIENQEYIKKYISALCGVEVSLTDKDFYYSLNQAILNYNKNHKVVTRVKECSMNCCTVNGKTQCQNACPFEAIRKDEQNHTTFIEDSKCIDCGFCIEACPNNNYIDKVEYFPLTNLS